MLDSCIALRSPRLCSVFCRIHCSKCQTSLAWAEVSVSKQAHRDQRLRCDCGLLCTIPKPPINPREAFRLSQHCKISVRRAWPVDQITGDPTDSLTSQRAGPGCGSPSATWKARGCPALQQALLTATLVALCCRLDLETQISFSWSVGVSGQWRSSPRPGMKLVQGWSPKGPCEGGGARGVWEQTTLSEENKTAGCFARDSEINCTWQAKNRVERDRCSPSLPLPRRHRLCGVHGGGRTPANRHYESWAGWSWPKRRWKCKRTKDSYRTRANRIKPLHFGSLSK